MTFKVKLELINWLIFTKNYTDYLEIGIDKGNCIRNVKCLHKDGVDPNLNVDEINGVTLHEMTSNNYFKCLDVAKKFDIIFIDGMHLCEYVLRDFLNAEQHLKQEGCIVMHDCNPPNEEAGSRLRKDAVWNGDVWKVLWILNKYRKDLDIKMFNTDQGITLIENVGGGVGMSEDIFYEMMFLPYTELDVVREAFLTEATC